MHHPTDRDRDARRTLARAIVAGVELGDHAAREALVALAHEVVMLENDETARVTRLSATLPPILQREGSVTVSTNELHRIYKLGVSHGLERVDMFIGGTPRVAAILRGSTKVRPNPAPDCSNCGHQPSYHPNGGPCTVDAWDSCNCAGYRWDPPPPQIGELVFVDLPPNCSIHSLPGFGPEDLARIVSTAIKVGEHWENQDGINPVYLDELAEVTKPHRS